MSKIMNHILEQEEKDNDIIERNEYIDRLRASEQVEVPDYVKWLESESKSEGSSNGSN